MIQERATVAAAMAGVAGGTWRLSPDTAPAGWACLPEISPRAPGADVGPVHLAREFTVATLHRWGVTARCEDIAVVVSEMLTNALRHARRRPGDTQYRSLIRLGLYNPGPWVMCAVADPSTVVPVPRSANVLAETGRGLHIIRALSDSWGYTTPDDTGKVVWATFTCRLPPSGPGPRPSPALTARGPASAPARPWDRVRASRSLDRSSALMPASATRVSISRAVQIRANARRPALELSATIATRLACRAISRLMLASPSCCAVAPAAASIAPTPRIATSRATYSSTPVASGLVSS
jgi:Histidine kinase-like ATPase domain